MNLHSDFLCLVLSAGIMSFDLPADWYTGGDSADSYDMGIDKADGLNGENVATIKSIEDSIKGFGTLMQKCLPGKFLVRRMRMSGRMKTQNVTGWAGFWVRVDDQAGEFPLSFDNMYERSVKGNSDWKEYSLVVDVPAAAEIISYGALLSGTGQIWFDELKFEVVDRSVETTGKGNDYNLPQPEPVNLSFDR
jgi:hypothetical protein